MSQFKADSGGQMLVTFRIVRSCHQPALRRPRPTSESVGRVYQLSVADHYISWQSTSTLLVTPLVTVTGPVALQSAVPPSYAGLRPETVYLPTDAGTENRPFAPTEMSGGSPNFAALPSLARSAGADPGPAAHSHGIGAYRGGRTGRGSSYLAPRCRRR